MSHTVQIIKPWEDDLIWCPSQCYLYIEFRKQNYIIYLRWRWQDPWTADIICSNEKWEKHNGQKWSNLDIDFWKDTQLVQCKNNAISKAKEFLNRLD